MHLRHIDPRSTDWMDAMVDEGKAEAESEMEAKGGEGAPVSAAPESRSSGSEARTAMAAAPPR